MHWPVLMCANFTDVKRLRRTWQRCRKSSKSTKQGCEKSGLKEERKKKSRDCRQFKLRGWVMTSEIRELCWQCREKLQTIRRKRRRRQKNRKWRRRLSLQLVTDWLTHANEARSFLKDSSALQYQLSNQRCTQFFQRCSYKPALQAVKEVKNAPFPSPLLRFSLSTAVNRSVWDSTLMPYLREICAMSLIGCHLRENSKLRITQSKTLHGLLHSYVIRIEFSMF